MNTMLYAIETQSHPSYVVYSDEGVLHSALALPPNCPATIAMREIELSCVYANDVYRVYEITYPRFQNTATAPDKRPSTAP